jgi:hypothetical protein
LEDDIILLFQTFGKEEHAILKYSEFCDAFAPKDKQCLKDVASRVPRNVYLTMAFEDMFSVNTRQIYKEVWVQRFLCEREIE